MKRILAVCTAAVLIMAGCASEKAEILSEVKIGFFPNITHAQALIGKNQGTYEKSMGVPIAWKQFNAGPAEIEAIFAGELDMGFIGPGPAINGYAKSLGDVQIIAGVADAGAVLVASKDSGITNVASLNGKRIAIPQFGNTQDLCLRALLKESGLTDTSKGGTVEIMQVANADMQGLLERGEIDGALVPEPWGAILEKKANAVIILDADAIWRNGNYPTAVIIARKDFVQKHPEFVKKFLEAHVELTASLQSNPAQGAKIINGELLSLTQKEIDETVLKTAMDRIHFNAKPNQEAVLEMVNLSLEAGFLKKNPDTAALFDLKPLEAVMKK